MLVDANMAAWWKKPWYKMVAWVYYRAVRKFAASFFYYGEERTLEDVLISIGMYE